jgi:hypothetical protein
LQRALDEGWVVEVSTCTMDGRIIHPYWFWPQATEHTSQTISYWGVVTPRRDQPSEASSRAGVRFDYDAGLNGEHLWFIHDDLSILGDKGVYTI